MSDSSEPAGADSPWERALTAKPGERITDAALRAAIADLPERGAWSQEQRPSLKGRRLTTLMLREENSHRNQQASHWIQVRGDTGEALWECIDLPPYDFDDLKAAVEGLADFRW